MAAYDVPGEDPRAIRSRQAGIQPSEPTIRDIIGLGPGFRRDDGKKQTAIGRGARLLRERTSGFLACGDEACSAECE
jgi:hypothetical protein